MSIKRDMAEATLRRLVVIARTPGLSADDKLQQQQDEIERVMEKWAKVALGYQRKQGGSHQIASR